MDTKDIFLNACHAVADQFEGFERYKNGQRLKKSASDKDIFFEITFQSSSMNHSSHIMMIPDMAVYSKALKKWQIKHTGNEFSNGLIYGNHLGYITPHHTWKKWNVAGLSFEKSVNEIADHIKKYVLPIFDLFNSKENAIEFLKNNGTKFNTYTENSLGPIDFLLCCSDKETSELFFNNYIRNSSLKKKILSFYEKLKTEEHIGLNHSEFVDARPVKLAYLNNLSIDESIK